MKRERFTLIELLVVMAIICILMGLLLVALSGGTEDARRVETLGLINGVYTAIEPFKLNYGKYPSPEGGDKMTTNSLLADAVGPGSNSLLESFSPSNNHLRDGVYCDSWGQPLRYAKKETIKGQLTGLNGNDLARFPLHEIWVFSAGPADNVKDGAPYYKKFYDEDGVTVLPVFRYRN